jgi:hypothetical protein
MAESNRALVEEIESIAKEMYGWPVSNRPRVIVTSAAKAGGETVFQAMVRVDPFLPPLARSGASVEDAQRALLTSLRCLSAAPANDPTG